MLTLEQAAEIMRLADAHARAFSGRYHNGYWQADGERKAAEARAALSEHLQSLIPTHGVTVPAVTDSRCTYLAFPGSVCNKCGRIHDDKPNPALTFGVIGTQEGQQ